MNIKLLDLELTNFRNIDFAHYSFNGEDSKIVGENRIGKTNTLEAIYWLLSDKLLNGSNDIAAIKPNHDTKLVTRVEGTFEIQRPELPSYVISIKKEYGEDWTRTKGSDELTLKGHFTNYYYNGVKQGTLRAFKNALYSDFGILEPVAMHQAAFEKIDPIRLLIDPTYLGNLGETDDWKYLRQLIIDLVGDVSDSDVFEANHELRPIQKELSDCGGRIDELKKKYSGEISNLKTALIGYNANIEMLESTAHPSTEEIEFARAKIKETDESILDLLNSKESNSTVKLDEEINEKLSQINTLKEQSLNGKEKDPRIQSLKAKVDELNATFNADLESKTNIQNVLSSKRSEQTVIAYKYDDCLVKREGFLKELKELDLKLANPEANVGICPTCNRPLDKDEQVKIWTARKAEILTEGRTNKARMAELTDQRENLSKEIDDLNKQVEEINGALEAIRTDRENIRKSITEAENQIKISYPPELDVLQQEVGKLQSQKLKFLTDVRERNRITDSKIADLAQKKEQYQKVLDDAAYFERQMATLDSTKEKKRNDALILAATEQKKELIDKFMFHKLNALDENVHRVFGEIKFQLIKTNLNGGFDPICKPYIYNKKAGASTSIQWKSGSKSEKVITGIAIADAIKNRLDLPHLPFLFDEGGEISTETFNSVITTEAQLICVQVKDNINKPVVLGGIRK